MLCVAAVQTAVASAQQFEAATLRPLPANAKPDGAAAAVALDPSRPESDLAPSLLSVDVSVADLAVAAYNIHDAGLQTLFLKQLPDWAQGDSMHLTARLPAGATTGQMRQMLQNLLRERFAIRSHEETRYTPVYLLQLDPKQPLLLTPHRQPCDVESKCGTHIIRSNSVAGAMQEQITGQTLDEMAGELGGLALSWAGLTYGPVVNATTLQGRYDGMFTFTPIFKADAESVITLPDALRHDLGLTLQKGTRPVTQRIIDHVERPTFD